MNFLTWYSGSEIPKGEFYKTCHGVLSYLEVEEHYLLSEGLTLPIMTQVMREVEVPIPEAERVAAPEGGVQATIRMEW